MDLSGIVRLSNHYGKDPELVLAGGGNTSVKDEETVFVKCSGTFLATIGEDGFVPASRAALAETMTKDYPADNTGREAAFLSDVMAARVIPGDTRRPSVEALLHSLFPRKYVVHLHPALVNGLTCGKDGEAKVKALFGDKAAWVPVADPGYMLGKLCHDVMLAYKEQMGKDVSLVFLENHGVFVAGDTEEEVAELLEGTMETLRAAVTCFPDEATEAADPALVEAIKEKTGANYVKFRTSPQILEFLQSEDAVSALMVPFIPDQVVYCGAEPVYVKDVRDLKSDLQKNRVILVKNVGMFTIGQTEKEAELAALLFLDAIKIAIYGKSFGGAKPLSADMLHFIVNWEAESYRQKEAQK